MQSQFLIVGSAIVIALVLVIIILQVIKKLELRYYRNREKNLEIMRNQVASTPVLLELSKKYNDPVRDRHHCAADPLFLCGLCAGILWVYG